MKSDFRIRSGFFFRLLAGFLKKSTKFIVLGLILLDGLYLIYKFRINPAIKYISGDVEIFNQGDPFTCTEEPKNIWWSDSDKPGDEYWQHIPPEEKSFPIAYTILAYERTDQVWRLLKSIYRKQNYYCIHFDKKRPKRLINWLKKKIDHCMPISTRNIHFLPPIEVEHSQMSVLEADLACMRYLWMLKSDQTISSTNSDISNSPPPWLYVINLTGQEFPLKNNLELTRILRSLDGANLVQQLRFWIIRKSLLHPTPPHNLKLHKGAVHVVLSWQFVNFMFTDSRVTDLLSYLPNVGVPDEAFFSTLNHNENLNAPGNFPYGDDEYKNEDNFFIRWKKFWPSECEGEWRHKVCIFSLEGMEPIFKIDSPHLFVNKFVMHINSGVMDITEKWFYDRQEWTYKNPTANISSYEFYSSLPQVKYQTSKRKNSKI